MTRVLPSDPIYKEVALTLHLLGVAKNPHMWFDIGTIESPEREVYCNILEHALEEILDDVPPTAFQGE